MQDKSSDIGAARRTKNNGNRAKSGQQKIAQERIEKLLSQAKDAVQDKDLSKRYVELARKLSTRYKVRLTADQKRMFCKECNAFLRQGINSRTRLERGKIVMTCLECDAVKRMDYKKKGSKVM